MSWSVYILRCSDDSLYTGITTDIDRRIKEHNGEPANTGAKFTRGRQPVTLVYLEKAQSRSLATKREMEIKCLTKKQKLIIINTNLANTCKMVV